MTPAARERALRTLRADMNRLRGRLFEAIEAVGLPPKQERAAKGLMRQITYDAQAALEAALHEGAQVP